MKDIILRTNNLTKKYKDFTALNNANITINKGDIYGLIGRNGAGKTTLMKVITTLTNKTNGEFYLFDKDDSDLTETKRRIGCLIENPAFFENLTAYQNLKYYAIQKGIVDYSQIDKVLDLVKLSDSKNKKFKTFSLGMKQRLGIAFAMLDNPDFVILDEPINGLDPIGISELRETLKK
uniref:ATP-binding cassette domain-containing protein n=2 Tax=Bacillati TaxID=1783272 RepID=UPI0013DA3BA5